MEPLAELAKIIARNAPDTGMNGTALPRTTLFRADEPTVPTPAVYEASLCLIAQGSKRVSIGEHSVVYDASHYLLVSVDMPLVGRVLEASPDAPYLCCKIDLDMQTLADLLASEGGRIVPSTMHTLAVYPTDPDLLDATRRLVRLLEQPETIPMLAPLYEREIVYRLLNGPHGPTLRHLARADSHLSQISRAITHIRQTYRDQLRIRDVASAAGMSESSLYAHFKTVTRMTPLEYQKQLRLQEARRLMVARGLNAGSAGFAVGYDSPSQFSREYRRLFGAPPRQDIERLQSAQSFVQVV